MLFIHLQSLNHTCHQISISNGHSSSLCSQATRSQKTFEIPLFPSMDVEEQFEISKVSVWVFRSRLQKRITSFYWVHCTFLGMFLLSTYNFSLLTLLLLQSRQSTYNCKASYYFGIALTFIFADKLFNKLIIYFQYSFFFFCSH
jgi:hypothetical protein